MGREMLLVTWHWRRPERLSCQPVFQCRISCMHFLSTGHLTLNRGCAGKCLTTGSLGKMKKSWFMVCQFPWCKYYHDGKLQAVHTTSVNTVGRYSQLSQESSSQILHTGAFNEVLLVTGNSRPPEVAHSTQPSFCLGTLGFCPLLRANKSIPTQLLENLYWTRICHSFTFTGTLIPTLISGFYLYRYLRNRKDFRIRSEWFQQKRIISIYWSWVMAFDWPPDCLFTGHLLPSTLCF